MELRPRRSFRRWVESDDAYRHGYSLMLSLASVAAIVGGSVWAEMRGESTSRIQVAMVVLFVPALVGSRLLFVLYKFRQWRTDASFKVLPRVNEGGALYGGLLLSLAASSPTLRVLDVPWGAFWDATGVAILIGVVITRFGCALRGCCAGRPSTSRWAMRLRGTTGTFAKRIPTQLLESVAALGLLLVVAASAGVEAPDGARFLAGLVGYCIARAVLEHTRERIDRYLNLSVNGLISVALGGGAVIVLVTIARK
jgi:phosphatidylglycerol---prolipoprotein diacylglyceryl transferase